MADTFRQAGKASWCSIGKAVGRQAPQKAVGHGNYGEFRLLFSVTGEQSAFRFSRIRQRDRKQSCCQIATFLQRGFVAVFGSGRWRQGEVFRADAGLESKCFCVDDLLLLFVNSVFLWSPHVHSQYFYHVHPVLTLHHTHAHIHARTRVHAHQCTLPRACLCLHRRCWQHRGTRCNEEQACRQGC